MCASVTSSTFTKPIKGTGWIIQKYKEITIFILLYFLTNVCAILITTHGQDQSSIEITTEILNNFNYHNASSTEIAGNHSVSILRSKRKRKVSVLPSMNVNYHGYGPENILPPKWKTWLTQWNLTELAKAEVEDDYNDGRLPDWTGHAIDGVDPPPWAIIPATFNRQTNHSSVYYGRPRFCYLAFERGPCNWNITRWFYKAHFKKCETFNYSGCDGNANNFMSKRNCEQQCGRNAAGCCGGR